MNSICRFDWLKSRDIAHRGLHKLSNTAVENSMASVSAAVKAGYAVEVDVQLTADNMIAVFHDKTVDRMTNGTGPIRKMSSQQLKRLRLKGTDEPVPMLTDILDVIGEKVPLFIEIKTDKNTDIRMICAETLRDLAGYKGPVAIMSFDERVVKWFKMHAPSYARGLILGRKVLLRVRSRLMASLKIKNIQPDFLACDIHLLPNSLAERWRQNGKIVLAWTIRDQQMEVIGRQHADALIFEPPAVTG